MKNLFLTVAVLALCVAVFVVYLNQTSHLNSNEFTPQTNTSNEVPIKDTPEHPEEVSNEKLTVGETASDTTTIHIPIMKPGIEGNFYDPIILLRSVEVPFTTEVLNATFAEMFKHKEKQYEGGYYAPVREHWGDFNFDKATLSDSHARVYFTGNYPSLGDFDMFFFKKPLEKAAFQFDTINEVSFYLNDKPFDLCIFNAKLGCVSEAYEPWHVLKN